MNNAIRLYLFCLTAAALLMHVRDAHADKPLKNGFELIDLTPADLDECSHFTQKTWPAAGPADACTEANVAAFCVAMATRPDIAGQYSCAPKMLRIRRACDGRAARPFPASCTDSCDALRQDPNTPVKDCVEDELADRLSPQQGIVGAAGLTQIVLTGATDFFVGRAKKELAAFLQERIADELCGSKIGKDLLKATCEALKPADEDALPEAVTSLHIAFREDLMQVPSRLVEKAFTNPSPEGCFLTVLARVGPRLIRGADLEHAIKTSLSGDRPTTCEQAAWDNILKIQPILADILAADSEASMRIRIAANSEALKKLGVEAELITALLNDGITLYGAIKQYKEVPGDSERRAALVRATFGVMQSTIAVLAKAAALNDVPDLVANVRSFGSVFEAIALGDYAAAMLRLFSVPAVLTVVTQATDLGEFGKKFRRYAQLVASIASAKSAEEVEKALEVAAAPIGSWREFRRRPGAGFLGGLIGVSAGGEFSLSDEGSNGAVIAPTLAVGLEIGFATAGSSSFQVFISALDLGALASLRVDGPSDAEGAEDKDAELVSEPTFASVFAPGLFLVFGMGNTPLALTAGAELAPAHRRFYACSNQCNDDEDFTTTTLPAVRVQAMLGVDLPVLPLF
ncbi:MAG: hypothetical protein HOW73_43965 [Polyangiaceae bacterium]|nr:hypothetical protein [Polyangiaceae bacterium]